MDINYEMLSNEELANLKKEFEQEKAVELALEQKRKVNLEERITYENYLGNDKVVNSYELKKYYDSIEPLTPPHSSGYQNLDHIITGFMEGELIVITGATGQGKTLFSRGLTKNLSYKDKECLWFTYEEPAKYFLDKFGKDLPIFYLPKILLAKQLNWIEKRIVEGKVKFKTKFIFIDHLHFLVPLKYISNTSILIGGIMRELKTMALRHEIVLFLIAHIYKVIEGEKPELSHLRDSSFIAQEADKVFYVVRHGFKDEEGDTLFSNETTVYVLKNRLTGKLGKAHFIYCEPYLIEKI